MARSNGGVGSSFLGYVPKCVLGGLLFYLGADLLYRWLVDSSRRLALLEYLSLLGIAFIIIKWGGGRCWPVNRSCDWLCYVRI